MNFQQIIERLNGRQNGKEWIARCPAHNDRKPSLSITQKGGKVLLHCHANCPIESVLKAAGLEMRDLYADSDEVAFCIEAIYPYVDEDGQLLYEVVRFKPKNFRQRQPDRSGGWIWNLDGVRRVVYRLPDVMSAKEVLEVEGEKDVETARGLHLVATCNPGGAGKWKHEFSELLRGKHVAVIADADEPGRKHAQSIACSLAGNVGSLKVLELPGAKDLTDWAEQGGTREQLLDLIHQAPEWSVSAATSQPIHEEPVKVQSAWPEPIPEEAFYGIAGEYTRAVEPHTEADPGAILIQLLVGFGNLIGRSAYFQVEASRHYGNLFGVLVGESSKARKGTGWDHARSALSSIDHGWMAMRIQTGLSSGEGLVWAVRDQIEKREPVKQNGRFAGEYQTVVADDGVPDKRLLVMESEFSSPLRVAAREGNTLTGVVRQAWDDGNLRMMTKNSPAKSTGAHISILGHITKDELIRFLTSTDAGNGFANRFLWFCSRRSKFLPEGGQVPEAKIIPILDRLREAAQFAKTVGLVKRDDAARALWYEIYEQLSEGAPGLVGAITNRGEAQVVRLSLLFALLDKASRVRIEHLRAALAWLIHQRRES